MGAINLGAALLGGTAFLAVAPATHAEQCSCSPGVYGNYGQRSCSAQYGGAYLQGHLPKVSSTLQMPGAAARYHQVTT